jgi:hypothetical protein
MLAMVVERTHLVYRDDAAEMRRFAPPLWPARFDVKRVAGSADITTVTSRLPWACVRRLTPLKRVHLAHPHPRLRQHLQEE